jgi:hypothetical protein
MQERRLYPRVSLDYPVALRGGNGRRFAARSVDISMAGVGLLVSREAVQALAQGGAVLTAGDNFQVTLGSEGPGALCVDCRAQVVRRLSLDQYHVAALFHGLDADAESAVASLIQSARRDG